MTVHFRSFHSSNGIESGQQQYPPQYNQQYNGNNNMNQQPYQRELICLI